MAAVRILVIGAGPAAADLHLPVLASLRDRGRVVLTAVCDVDVARGRAAQTQFGFSSAGGDAAAAILNPDVDAIYIFGSAQMHAELGRLALEAGKHLFVEKPIAPDFETARELAAMARERGLIAAGGHNRRFTRAFTALRQQAGSASWRYGEAVSHKPDFGKSPPFGAASWLTANGIHALDALLDTMGGLPATLSAQCDGAAQMFSAVMTWPGGAQALFASNNGAGLRREEYAFHAPGLTCRITDGGLTVEAAGRAELKPLPMLRDGIEAEHLAFLDAVRTGEPPPHAIEALAPSLFVAELIEQGFQGEVCLPTKARTRANRASRPTIALIEPARLLAALGRCLPDCRLISVTEDETGIVPDVSVLMVGGGARPIPASLLDRLPDLRMVSIAALSLERYGVDALHRRGLTVFNATQAYADGVAEFALGLAILGRRRAFGSHEAMRAGGWGIVRPDTGWRGAARNLAQGLRPALRSVKLEAPLLSLWRQAPALSGGGGNPGAARQLAGATVGLVGWGPNAHAFAARLIAGGAQVAAWSEHADPKEIEAAGVRPASLAEVLSADIVSLHRALTPDTRHSLGQAELARLRPGAVLINIARGALIEPGALLARLRRGDIFACLDTFETEPPAKNDPLRRLPNVFLTSHIAGGNRDMQERAAEEIVEKVARALSL